MSRPRTARHGTRSKYTNDHCRCRPCIAANNVYQLACFHRRKLKPPGAGPLLPDPPAPVPGTATDHTGDHGAENATVPLESVEVIRPRS